MDSTTIHEVDLWALQAAPRSGITNVKVDLPPLAWDEVGFLEFSAIVAEVCDPETASPLIAMMRAADEAYENPGYRSHVSPRFDPAARMLATRQLREFLGRQKSALQRRISGFHGAYLIGAISGLGALPELQNPDHVGVPGRYDREVEWLCRLQLASDGPVPTWDEILDALNVARRCLLVEFYVPKPEASAFDKLRERSVMSSQLGATYGPIAQDLAQRLLGSVLDRNPMISDSHLRDFIQDTELVFERHANGIKHIVSGAAPALAGVTTHTQFLRRVMDQWHPQPFVDALTLEPTLANRACLEDLTTTESSLARGTADPRAQPLIELSGSALLLLPRRILSDRHELLDQAIARFLRSDGSTPGIYPDLRARTLDDLVADSLRLLLPGCRVLVGENWLIGGKHQERDVVVLYEDVAICIETKAPQLIPSVKSAPTDVVSVLRDDVAKGVRQSISIADSLERGTAELANGELVPPVRRAYRLVATFNGWWGIDLATDELCQSGVLPSPDAAIITSADKFVCHEKLFESPADFIAYLDYRLSHQRRPWIVVSDEFELIGGYFTNPRDDWRRRPPRRANYLIKPTFQDDVTQTLRSAYLARGERSIWLRRKHTDFVEANLHRLETTRPAGWLKAFSGLSRLPLRTQIEIEGVEAQHSRGRTAGLHTVLLPDNACIVVTFAEASAIKPLAWTRLLDKQPTLVPLVVIDQSTLDVIAVRGIDELEPWIDPGWVKILHPAILSAHRKLPKERAQRKQPRRSHRRTR